MSFLWVEEEGRNTSISHRDFYFIFLVFFFFRLFIFLIFFLVFSCLHLSSFSFYIERQFDIIYKLLCSEPVVPS